MIKFRHKGDFSGLERYLGRSAEGIPLSVLDKYGQEGVRALSASTPKDTGTTAGSWYYRTEKSKGVLKLIFCNSNIQNGTPVAVVIQYGHAARNGGFVQGRDYINPALRPIFDRLAQEAWEEVRKRSLSSEMILFRLVLGLLRSLRSQLIFLLRTSLPLQKRVRHFVT